MTVSIRLFHLTIRLCQAGIPGIPNKIPYNKLSKKETVYNTLIINTPKTE